MTKIVNNKININLKNLIYLIKSDLHRCTGKSSFNVFIRELLLNKGFQISFLYRICNYFYIKNNKIFLTLFNIFFYHYRTYYSVDLSYETQIASGLYLGHVYGIVVSPKARIGKNVNLSNGVTIGRSSRGSRKGYPTIGDNVFIGPNAVIIGNVFVGNNVAIGANCVVTKDIPDNAVVVGIPAKVISYDSSMEYIIKTDYE